MESRVRRLIITFLIVIILGTILILEFSLAKLAGQRLASITFSHFSLADVLSKLDAFVVLFLLQAIALIGLAILGVFRFLKEKVIGLVTSTLEPQKRIGNRARTDIDKLYSLLKRKKSLKLGEIVDTFGINQEQALDWCKILENNELVTINYPTFAEPEIEISNKVVNNEKETKV